MPSSPLTQYNIEVQTSEKGDRPKAVKVSVDNQGQRNPHKPKESTGYKQEL